MTRRTPLTSYRCPWGVISCRRRARTAPAYRPVQSLNDAQREAVATAHPPPPQFTEDLLQAFYDGLKHRPETTQFTGLADIMADQDPHFHRVDFCSLMRSSRFR